MAEAPIVWHATALTPDGYGDEARSFLRALEVVGRRPALHDPSRQNKDRVGLVPREARQLQLQMDRCEQMQDLASAVHVHHCVPGPALRHTKVEGCVNVSRSTFETDRIPSSWLPYLTLMDEIWVPTAFNVETYARCGVPVERLRIVGQTIDFDLFHPQAAPLHIPELPEDCFVFLANFDFSERKGWRQLLAAWEQAFSPHDSVCLLLKAGTISFDDRLIRERITQFWHGRQTAPVVLLPRMLPADQMPQLYAAADAYVLPTRGEGWGRPFMEALAMNLPTIASRFSGLLEFVSEDYAWLVDGEMVAVPEDAEIANNFYQGHRWFEADVEQLAALLREIASDPAAAAQHAAPARERLLERFSPRQIGEQVGRLADQVQARRKPLLTTPTGKLHILEERSTPPGVGGILLGLQEATERWAGQRYGFVAVSPDPRLHGVSGMTLSWAPDQDSLPLLLLLDHGTGSPELLATVGRQLLDLIAVTSPDREQELLEAGVPPGLLVLLDEAPWGEELAGARFHRAGQQLVEHLEVLAVQRPTPIRSIIPATLDVRAQATLWAPDFRDRAWRQALQAWCAGPGRDPDRTLAVWMELSDTELASKLEELQQQLPDDPDLDIMVPATDKQASLAVALACQDMLCGPGCLSPPGFQARLPRLELSLLSGGA